MDNKISICQDRGVLQLDGIYLSNRITLRKRKYQFIEIKHEHKSWYPTDMLIKQWD